MKKTLITLLSATILHAAEKPNLVIIYADDLGYGDVQCYNPDRGKIPTPHIDRLAAQGMRFTDGHSSSGVCFTKNSSPKAAARRVRSKPMT